MMKLFRWIHKLFARKDKAMNYNAGCTGLEKGAAISYYPAKYCHNDLDNEDDYYLEVKKHGDNKFVRKESANHE